VSALVTFGGLVESPKVCFINAMAAAIWFGYLMPFIANTLPALLFKPTSIVAKISLSAANPVQT